MGSDERYADRLDSANYADDPDVGWFSSDPPAEAWVPERLVDRLRALGRAYELHLLPHLPGPEALSLNAVQVLTLIEEMDFLGERVNDPALTALIADLREVLGAAARGDGLWVEGN